MFYSNAQNRDLETAKRAGDNTESRLTKWSEAKQATRFDAVPHLGNDPTSKTIFCWKSLIFNEKLACSPERQAVARLALEIRNRKEQ